MICSITGHTKETETICGGRPDLRKGPGGPHRPQEPPGPTTEATMSERDDGGPEFYDDDIGDEDEWWVDGGLGADGQCSKAGSEECDWECPYAHREFYAGSALWNKRHDAGVPIDGCECSECRQARLAAFAARQGEQS